MLAPFVEETILLPFSGLGTLVEKLAIDVRVYFWTLDPILLIYMSLLMPITHCFRKCSFVSSFKIRKCEVLYFVLF